MLSVLPSWLRSLFRRGPLEREMQEEMQLHLDRATARLMARGLSREDAQRAARREFGNVEYLQEKARDARGGRWLEALLADARFGLRHFARTPLSTVTMIVVLALGIGTNTALFAVLHSAATLPPAGVQRDDQLVRIRGQIRLAGQTRDLSRGLSFVEVQSITAQQRLFSVAAWTYAGVVLETGDPERGVSAGDARFVTDNYFRVLGVRPVLGAGLPAGAGAQASSLPVAVISHTLWLRLFGQSPDVIGKSLNVNGRLVTIVGVTAPEFAGAQNRTDNLLLWLPLSARTLLERSGTVALSSADSMIFYAVARLQPGVSVGQTQATVRGVAQSFANSQARRARSLSADVAPLLRDNDSNGSQELITPARLYGFVALLILLIACSNVSALLVGLAVARRREIAVRLSLGASRFRVVRQLVTESVLLACCAGALGLAVVAVVARVLTARVADLMFEVHWPAAIAAFAIALSVGLLFGLSPALHATRLAVADVLKDASATVAAGRSWLQRGLVVTQVALTQPLLLGVVLTLFLILGELNRTPASMLNDHIVSARLDLRAANLSASERRELFRTVQRRLLATPGVIGAVPKEDGQFVRSVMMHPDDQAPGISATTFQIELHTAAAGYFALMGITLVRGRDFLPEERTEASTAVIIGSDLARELWGSADPLGKRLVPPSYGATEQGERAFGRNAQTAMVVVGVVDANTAGNSAHSSGRRVHVYSPVSFVAQTMLVRTAAPAEAMLPLVRSIISAEAPRAPIVEMKTLAALEAEMRGFVLKVSGGMAAAGLLALFLSAIGLYAVVAFAVNQRIREIGIRTALGAPRAQVVRMFLMRGFQLSVFGLLAGVPIGLIVLELLTRAIDAPSAHPALLAAITALAVLAVAALASWLPARRAAAIDPLQALRLE